MVTVDFQQILTAAQQLPNPRSAIGLCPAAGAWVGALSSFRTLNRFKQIL